MPRGPNEMATIEIKVPDIGDFKDVAVIELLVKPGDNTTAGETVVARWKS